MKFVERVLVIAPILLAASLSMLMYGAASGQSPATKQVPPDALVADLYRAHDHKRSPFFQTRSRALLYRYFEKDLADMIWKDAVKSKGEVGAIDGDPLYNAQDMEIKKFAIGKAGFEGGKARVPVTFENFGQKKSIVFVLVNGPAGWRISDLDYGDGSTLRGFFKG